MQQVNNSPSEEVIRPVDQGRFIIQTGLGHNGSKWLSHVLNMPELNMIAHHERKIPELDVFWIDCLNHEMKKGIDGYFLPYFEAIDRDLNSYKAVVDTNSWQPFSLPGIDTVFHIDLAFFVVRNPIQSINSMMKVNQDQDYTEWLEDVYLKYQWKLLGNNEDEWYNFTQFEKWCFWWTLNDKMSEWLKDKLGEERVLVYKFEDLLTDEKLLREVINLASGQDSSKISSEKIKEFQKTDVNRKVKGKRGQLEVWKNWSDEEKDAVRRICGDSIQKLGYSLPEEERPAVLGGVNVNEFSNKTRNKWAELPATRQGRSFSKDMLGWSDADLLEYWEECRVQTTAPEVRGWFQDLYKDEFSGKRIADIGSGIGVDGIYFAQHGAKVTFLDIVKENLILVERVCKLKGIEAEYYFIEDFFNFNFTAPFDVLMSIGSMHHAPFDFMRKEAAALNKWIRPSGKVVQLAYPKERYDALGCKSFEEFGKRTDGERTPWAEWYNDEKILALWGKDYVLNWSRNFGVSENQNEFNWFDLSKRPDTVIYTEKTNLNIKPAVTASENLPNVKSDQIFSVSLSELPAKLGYSENIIIDDVIVNRPYEQYKMEENDAPILRYLYRNFKPKRHLEFGTWQGMGTTYALEESDATVWTINLFDGEKSDEGKVVYANYAHEYEELANWAQKLHIMPISKTGFHTDSIGFIGRHYLQRNLGNRVCQIYSDSTKWDDSNYPDGFFDTIFVDGGHTPEVVISDTTKALRLLKPGGLILWHDFCPELYGKTETVTGVIDGINQHAPTLENNLQEVFWIKNSFILAGLKK